MACLHYWNAPFQVSTHHLARRFVDSGWAVAYLSAPVTPLHLFKRPWEGLGQRLGLFVNQWRRVSKDGLFPLVPGALIAPDNRPVLDKSWLVKRWPRMTWPSVRRVLAQSGFAAPDVLYFDNFYHAGYLDIIRPRVSCYHMVDDYSAFPGYSQDFRGVEAELCQRVDLVAYPAITMRPVVDGFGSRDSVFVPNGVDFERFSNSKVEKPRYYECLKGRIAVYVGATDQWFDQELMLACAKQLPDVEFVILGPRAGLSSNLLRQANVHALGTVSRDALPGFLRFADVGLVPFDTYRFAKLLGPVRPLKVLEYLAAGLPVVSRSWAELEIMNAPIILAASVDEFVSGISSALLLDNGRARRVEYAKRFDWKDIFSDFERSLLERLGRA